MGNKKSPYKEDQMSIAPGYTVADWKKLDLDSENSLDWCEAIKIFNARIRGRYLDPVDKLIELDKKRANEKDRSNRMIKRKGLWGLRGNIIEVGVNMRNKGGSND